MNVTHALKWSFLSEVASKAVQPIVFIILARLLTPEDYGVVASATMVISFSQIFWEAGMGKAIIQYQGDDSAAANVAFWVNHGLGTVVAGVLIAISGLLANQVFHDARVAPVLQVMAIQVFLSASASIHTALLQKAMNFKVLFWVRMSTVAVPGLFSIPLAWSGMGYWALVAGTLAGQLMQVLILWKISAWKPALKFDLTIASRLIRFGAWVAVSGLLGWFYTWADSLAVGIVLGPRELGLYRTSDIFLSILFGFMFGPLLPVLYSYFSNIQQDREAIQATLFKVIKMITFLSIPLAFLTFANAEFISNFIFGQKWQGIELVLGILALTHGYANIVGANGEAYRALGTPYHETRIMALSLGFYLVAYWFSLAQGFEAFLWARFCVEFLGLSIHLWTAKKTVNLSMQPTLRYVLKISLICVPPVLAKNLLKLDQVYLDQTAISVIGVLWVVGALYFVERSKLIPTFFALALRK